MTRSRLWLGHPSILGSWFVLVGHISFLPRHLIYTRIYSVAQFMEQHMAVRIILIPCNRGRDAISRAAPICPRGRLELWWGSVAFAVSCVWALGPRHSGQKQGVSSCTRPGVCVPVFPLGRRNTHTVAHTRRRALPFQSRHLRQSSDPLCPLFVSRLPPRCLAYRSIILRFQRCSSKFFPHLSFYDVVKKRLGGTME